jgi:hypothetical protein
MISYHTVVVAVLIEAAALTLGAALLVGHGGWVALRDRAVAPRLAAARRELAAALHGGRAEAPLGSLLVGLPRSARLRLLGDLSPSVAGADRDRLRAAADAAGLLRWAARAGRSRRWTRRLRGARVFTLLGGGHESMAPLLDDRRPEVRAQAAEWAAEEPQREIVAHLVDLLNDDRTLCRFTVRDSLLRIGAHALPPLADRLAEADGARAARALEVAVWLPDARLLEPAMRLAADAHPPTRALAAQLLGALGGNPATELLIALLDDPSPRVRGAAARALGAAHHWPAAARLAEALRDPTWEVRRAAGLALHDVGAPGHLMLRRTLASEDRFAADMAELVLALPDRDPGSG